MDLIPQWQEAQRHVHASAEKHSACNVPAWSGMGQAETSSDLCLVALFSPSPSTLQHNFLARGEVAPQQDQQQQPNLEA